MDRLILTLVVVMLWLHCNAQDPWDGPQDIAKDHLLKRAIIHSPGQSERIAFVRIKDGLIHKISDTLTPSPIEHVIKDTVHVYPGFISAFSHCGIPKSNEEVEKPSRPGTPTDEQAGITPYRKATQLFDPKDKSLDQYRKQGITVAHVAPKGNMLPGQSAVYLLGEGSAEKLLLGADRAMAAQLKGSRGMYPNTVIAVMAKWRELIRNAELAQNHQEAFARKQTNKRPQYSETIQSLIPVADGQLPVYFRTPSALAVRRAMALQEDFDYDMVLTELNEAWFVSDIIKSGMSVVATLDLPKKQEHGSDMDSTDLQMLAFNKRKNEAYDQQIGQSKWLVDQGAILHFATTEVKTEDILTNMRRMVLAGLSPVDALAAWTIHPAQLLGISHLCGTVEEGKMANLVLADAPIFEEKASITQVFVEGKKYDYAKSSESKKGESIGDYSAVLGTWDWVASTPDGDYTGELNLTEDNGLSGSMTVMGEDLPVRDIEWDGKNLQFVFDFVSEDGSIPLTVDVVVKGESYEGDVSSDILGSFPFVGTRTSKPE